MKNNSEVEQNAIESSGKERTFIAVALKSALRHINNRSKINLLLFDEIMGKLVKKSIPEFVEILNKIKSEIEKIIIIEHIHPVKPDYIIEVNKNSKGVSSFTFN